MSKIKAVRLINLNYNHNAMRIDDECFELGGESTLLSLRNGGGKSVIVQMLMAPFMNKRYRDLEDRTFESYFTTNKPTFILVEWMLDHEGGHVLTGMMVRKRQETSGEERQEPLEVINFIHEYDSESPYDIHQIPLIQTLEKTKKLIRFNEAKTLFEKLKKELHHKFAYYDMTQSNQARRYFQHLQENKIYHKEWESIVKRINLKESGLSELFQKSKSVEGLVEEWFLKVVEDKLNREDKKIERLNQNIQKYTKQYKANQSKLMRQANILHFQESAQDIFEVARAFEKEQQEKQALENTMAHFIRALEEELSILDTEGNTLETTYEKLLGQIENLKYEALCVAIYALLDTEGKLLETQEQLQTKLSKADLSKQELNTQLAIYQCANVYEDYVLESQEVQKYENDLIVLREKDKDLAPERNNLGYTLNKYYEEELENCKATQLQLQEALAKQYTEEQTLQKTVGSKRKEQNEYAKEQGSLRAKIKTYDKLEHEFNKHYKENLIRNIIGLYQDEALHRKELEVHEALEEKMKQIKESKEAREQTESELLTLQRQHAELRASSVKKDYAYKAQQSQKESYEKELEVRRELIKYIGETEEKLFEKDALVSQFDVQIMDLKATQLKDELAYQKQVEAYKRLQTGRLLSLPPEIEEYLEQLGIHPIYGMDWLRKNHIEVIDDPFLPYALIMSNKELSLLKESPFEAYTASPIPIISRESLGVKGKWQKEKVYDLAEVHFLLGFNEGLLREEDLKHLLEAQQKILEGLEVQIKVREEAIALNEAKRNQLFYQEVTKQTYEQTQVMLQQLEKEQQELVRQEDRTIKALDDKQSYMKVIAKQLEQLEKARYELDEKRNQIEKLKQAYRLYKEDKEQCEKVERMLEDLEEWIETSYEKIQMLEKEKDYLKGQQRDNQVLYKELVEKSSCFLNYKEGTLIARDKEDLIARYESLVQGMTQEESQIEALLSKAEKRFKRKQDELLRLTQEYQLKEEAYKTVRYDYIEEKILKEQLKSIEQTIERLRKEVLRVTKECAVIEDRLAREKQKLEREYNKPLKEKAELVGKNFEQAILEQTVLLNKNRSRKESLNKTRGAYARVQVSINDYADLPLTEPLTLFIKEETVERQRAELVRDYKLKQEGVRTYETTLHKVIARLLKEEQFEEVFFKKPLETLQKIENHPTSVIENLETTLQAYQKMMEKLEADIELIEKEKQSVLDGFNQYVFEVYEHIGRIDKNATVNIRGKSIKMLKIEQPQWESYEAVYTMRLKYFIEQVTQAALEKLNQNENIEELISKWITTKNLYNEVIGIGNIEVKLYKIEEEKEYMITWDEVAKNSGGEGFLSAFVVLSSLLSYMRRDDTDLFGVEKESGKVLLMDNPFAQTNASHLLKPLMDMANKRNTQLICLSGLGGDSIYSCFNNIYVLSLMTSRIQEGLQYVRSNHLKGKEAIEELVAVQIETDRVEQIELF